MGAKKKGKREGGRIYNDDKRECYRHVPGLAVPCQTHYPDIFPCSTAVSRHPHSQSWIVISSSPKQCSFLRGLSLFSLVSVTSSPCHLIFHIPSDVSTNPASHATAKRHQSHHLRSEDPRPSIHMDLALSSLASPASPASPCLAFSPRPFRVPRTRMHD